MWRPSAAALGQQAVVRMTFGPPFNEEIRSDAVYRVAVTSEVLKFIVEDLGMHTRTSSTAVCDSECSGGGSVGGATNISETEVALMDVMASYLEAQTSPLVPPLVDGCNVTVDIAGTVPEHCREVPISDSLVGQGSSGGSKSTADHVIPCVSKLPSC